MTGAATPVIGYLALTVGPVSILAMQYLPSLIVLHRDPPHKGSVLIVNLSCGWTFVGWVINLAMACRSIPTPPIAKQTYAPPGWYPDPETRWHRWWSGNEWGPAR